MVFLQYLTTVFDTIDEAIMLIGIEPHDTFRLLMANAGFSRATGHTIDDIGKLVSEIVEPVTYKRLVPHYLKVVKTKKPVSFTEWYDVPLGRLVYEVKFIPILNAVGECVHIACVTRNVTEMHRLREQLAETVETLEQVAHNLKQL